MIIADSCPQTFLVGVQTTLHFQPCSESAKEALPTELCSVGSRPGHFTDIPRRCQIAGARDTYHRRLAVK